MKKMYKVEERIYHDFSDEILSSTEYLLKTYADDNPDLYISFTKLDKLGINPTSKYGTPIGIYTYPLAEILTEVKEKTSAVSQMLKNKIGSFVPFAGDSPWVWIIEPNRSQGKFIEDIGDTYMYTHSDYEKDVELLKELYLKPLFADYSKVAPAMRDFAWRDFISGCEETARHNSPGGDLWNVTRILADRLSYLGVHQKSSVKWNKVFRDLGYIGIADKSGKGIIHPSEPLQAVFFSTKSFNILEKIENYARTNTTEENILESLKEKMDKLLVLIPTLILKNIDDEIYWATTSYAKILDFPFMSLEDGRNIYNFVMDQILKLKMIYSSAPDQKKPVYVYAVRALKTQLSTHMIFNEWQDLIIQELSDWIAYIDAHS